VMGKQAISSLGIKSDCFQRQLQLSTF